MTISPVSRVTLERRGLAYASRAALSSVEMTVRSFLFEPKMDFSSLISAASFFISASSSPFNSSVWPWRNSMPARTCARYCSRVTLPMPDVYGG